MDSVSLTLNYHPTNETSTVIISSSKSISNRLVMLNKTYASNLLIDNLSTSNDTQLLVSLLLEIKTKHSSLEEINMLDAQNCGTAFRFLCAYLCFQKGKWLLTGNDAMKKRPVKGLVDVLVACGAFIRYTEKEGFPPLEIHGSDFLTVNKTLQIDSQQSSQFISAILFILPLFKKDITLQFNENTSSLPYIYMTVILMQNLGIKISMCNNTIHYTYTPPLKHPMTIKVEPDWSSAAYWFVWVALHNNSEVFIQSLHKSELQADRIIEDIVKIVGVEVNYKEEGVLIRKIKDKKPLFFDFDASHCLDLVPTLAVFCCGLQIKAIIKGIANLAYKESNRIEALIKELGQIAQIQYVGNALEILPLENQKDIIPYFHTYNDHRLAMSFALLSGIYSEIHIENPDCVNKSYPKFWKQLQKVGVECKNDTLEGFVSG